MTSVMMPHHFSLSHQMNSDSYSSFDFDSWNSFPVSNMEINIGGSSPSPSETSAISSDFESVSNSNTYCSSSASSNPTSPVISSTTTKRSRSHRTQKVNINMSSGAKQQYTAELDVACRICGDRASGFHYGVHSCEGCKGFFRRTLKKQLKYKPCKGGIKCNIDTGNRNKCQYCRYQRCINAGMSPDAVRFGRMPKLEREKLIADKEELSTNSKKRILDLRTLSDSIKTAFKDTLNKTQLISDSMNDNIPFKAKDLIEETCIVNTLNREEFIKLSVFKCYQQMVVPLVEASVKFSKQLPGFLKLPLNDQILLMKQGSLAVAIVMMHSMVDKFTIKLKGKHRDLVINRKAVLECRESQLLLQHVISVCDQINSLQIQQVELALFAAVILLTDTPDLQSSEEVEKNQMEILDALRLELKHNHPKQKTLFPKLLMLITDLRQIVEDFQTHLQNKIFNTSSDLSCVEPLLREIFNLC